MGITHYKDTTLTYLATKLTLVNVSASEITLSGFIIGVWAFLMLPYHHYTLAIIFVCLNRLAYCLDKRVAIQTQETDKETYLRIILNYIFCAGFFFFFSMGCEKHFLLTTLIVFSFSIAHSCKLFLKLILEKRLSIEHLPQKIRLGGMLSDVEIFIVMILVCLFPLSYAILGTIFVAQSWISIIGHFFVADKVFKP